MRVVVDTNILVSGLLNPFGPSGEIVRMLSGGLLVLCYDARIIVEYKEVLARPKFQFNQKQIADFINFLETGGELISTGPLREHLPDRDDEVFLEVAASGRAKYLITGNLKHYPPIKGHAVKVVSPGQFIERYKQEAQG